jgi:hypothetical protein
MYYLLEHEYKEASLAFRALKTTDLARVQCLGDSATELGFDVFLAVLEKKEDGGVEMDHQWGSRDRRDYYKSDDGEEEEDDEAWHSFDEVYDTEIYIKKLVDLDGRLLRSGMPIATEDLESNLISECDPFQDVDDRNEDYEGYMGNSVRLYTLLKYPLN